MLPRLCTILALCLLLPAGATALPIGGPSSSTLNVIASLEQDGKPGEIFGAGTSASLGIVEQGPPPSLQRRGRRYSWRKSTDALLSSLGGFTLVRGGGGGGKDTPVPPVPEPGTIMLIGGGVAGLALLRRAGRRA